VFPESDAARYRRGLIKYKIPCLGDFINYC
jgi:hypothetical protein